MTRKEWQAIERARKVLGLGDRATLAEMKKAYRRLSKKHHPDTRGAIPEGDREMMYRLTDAYNLLMRYCEAYRFPLAPPENHIYDAEDWWLDRFGEDPLWGKRR
jgi:curved DNA-binding protein CbpA